jgi:zinc transport system ATP-binding protein
LGARGSKEQALDALAQVKIAHLAQKRFNELSGGQQQRVVIAKALAGNADILILDEPATGIDEHSQKEFYGLLRELQQRSITIVMVSHEVEMVLGLVTRVICLNRSVLYDGSPEHFEADTYLSQAYKMQHIELHHHHEDAPKTSRPRTAAPKHRHPRSARSRGRGSSGESDLDPRLHGNDEKGNG